jgi:phosphate-selective porin OprO/OprP
MDVYLDIRETPLGTFRFGQWRQPLGMDGLTSVKDLTFLERALPFAFLPFRQIGFGVFDHSRDETITWAASVYRFPTDAFGGNVGDNGGVGMATRGTFAPWITRDGRQLIHLGGGYSGGDPANDVVRYRNQPEFFISETGGADLVPIGVPTNVPPFVDTGAIPTHTFHLFSVEGGLVLNSLYMQSEVLYAVIDRIDQPTTSFSGAYAQAGYFLTGEIRPYNRTNGVFGRVKPLDNFGHGGCGAWELAARWSYLDLNDEDIAGGRLNDVTVGVNWYLNSNTKFQFNWIQAFLDNPAFGDSNADIFAFRGQVDF